jgi:hypothetical protein
MKKWATQIASLVVLAGFLSAGAGSPPPPDSPKGEEYHAIVEAFFQKVKEGKPEDGVQYIMGMNPWMARKTDDLEKAKAGIANLAPILGEYYGHELIDEKRVGERFVHLTYFGYYDRQPMRFTFQFYKAKDSWKTYYFIYDDRFSGEITAGASFDMMSSKSRK